MFIDNASLDVLANDVMKAVALFAEFGQRGHYERKGRTIIENDVYDVIGEGIFLARCARKVAKQKGVAYAHEWALEQFTDNVYNRLQARNKIHSTGLNVRLWEARDKKRAEQYA